MEVRPRVLDLCRRREPGTPEIADHGIPMRAKLRL